MAKINKFSTINERNKFDTPISVKEIMDMYPNCKLYNVEESEDSPIKWSQVKFNINNDILVYSDPSMSLYLFVNHSNEAIHIISIYNGYNIDYLSQRFVIVGRDSVIVLDPTRNEAEEFYYR